MYRKLLYNDDCILEVETNNLYFDSDEEYQKYIAWAIKYPRLEEELVYSKNKELRWNQGVDEIVDGVKTLYHLSNGSKYLEEYYSEDGSVEKELEYFDNGVLARKKLFKSTGKIEQVVFTKEGNEALKSYITVEEGIEIHTNIELFKDGRKYKQERVEYNRVDNSTRTTHYRQYLNDLHNTLVAHKRILRDKSLELIYTANGYLHSKRYTVGGTDKVKVKYWPTSNNIITLYTHTEDYYSYSEFYANKIPRAIGRLNKDKQMHGEWTYFHHNGEIESSHFFNKGKLIKESKLYFEDGSLNNTFTHA